MRQAGLFSAVTSAFIIEVHSHLQQDPNDVTAALLRVLIYKIDNTTFGTDTPALPQWTGPPRTIVQVQAILFASLAASLFSAFLAMLGKQWLNRYASTDLRGTATERSQNRQRKLDGIVAWYFDHVMEFLPLMLQAALLLLGCALSHYLWGINITVASVILGVTSSGLILYIFLVAAGAAYESCPYQTPGSLALRYLSRRVLFSDTPGSDSQTTAFDLRCISWMLQTSLDKTVHLSTLKHLTTMVALADVDPTLVVDCFNAFVGCVRVRSYEVVVVRGLEELAAVSALGLFNTISHLLGTDPTSRILEDLHQRYSKVFPPIVNFHGHQFYHVMSAVHCLFTRSRERQPFEWSNYEPSAHELAMVSRNLVSLARFKYQRAQQMKVPRWALRFVLHSFSLNPPPPTSVVANCLSIVAIELGCDVLNAGTAMSTDERYVCTRQMGISLTPNQCASGADLEPDN